MIRASRMTGEMSWTFNFSLMRNFAPYRTIIEQCLCLEKIYLIEIHETKNYKFALSSPSKGFDLIVEDIMCIDFERELVRGKSVATWRASLQCRSHHQRSWPVCHLAGCI